MTTLGTAINTLAPDNTSGLITPAIFRQLLKDGMHRHFENNAELQAATIPSIANGGPQWVETQGFTTANDYGGACYIRISGPPAWGTQGTLTSADGQLWQLYSKDGTVRPQQFGALSHRAYNDVSIDQWQFFEDCKYYLINMLYGGTMDIPPGWYYLGTRPHKIEGAVYNLVSTGIATLTFDYTTHGIIVEHAYGAPGSQTIDAEGDPYTGDFDVFLGKEMYSLGHVYVAVQAGTPLPFNGTTYPGKPHGTGNGQVDGTVIWNYVREMTGAETMQHGADGSRIEGVGTFCQNWNDRTIFNKSSGIIWRARGVMIRSGSSSFPGCGVVWAANGNPFMRGGGQVNDWAMDRCACYFNGVDGFNIGYSDANAGVAKDLDMAFNGRWGIANWCFLDNLFMGVQSAIDGNPVLNASHQYPSQAVYNGRSYRTRLAIVGTEPEANYNSPTPDISPDWLYDGGSGSDVPSFGWPAWSNVQIYEPSGAYSSNNANDRSLWAKLYFESGTNPAQFAPRNLVMGGLLQAASGGLRIIDNVWSGGLDVQYIKFNKTTGTGYVWDATFSGPTFSLAFPKPVFYLTDYEGKTFQFGGEDWTIYNNTDYVFKYDEKVQIRICGVTTLKTWGSGVSHPYYTHVNSLVIGDTAGDGRLVIMGTSPWGTGTHAQGEQVWNIAASVGQPKGWVCTVTGTPGTWVSMGNL